MNTYLIFEWLVVTMVVALCLRRAWRQWVRRPAPQPDASGLLPKTGCDTGCKGCSTNK
jgi:hypothetical protein